jgi:hypothetical protein
MATDKFTQMRQLLRRVREDDTFTPNDIDYVVGELRDLAAEKRRATVLKEQQEYDKEQEARQ